MNKFEEQYRIIMESMGSESMTDRGIYDIFLNLVLDKIQDIIREQFGSLGNLDIEYEKTYVCLHWSDKINNNEIKYKLLIDERALLVMNALINEELVFENTLDLDSIDILIRDLPQTLINALSFVDERIDDGEQNEK